MLEGGGVDAAPNGDVFAGDLSVNIEEVDDLTINGTEYPFAFVLCGDGAEAVGADTVKHAFDAVGIGCVWRDEILVGYDVV